jgi:hypothetical protein
MRCPKCQRIYKDPTLRFCLDDGIVLEPLPSRFRQDATTEIMNAPSESAKGAPIWGRGQARSDEVVIVPVDSIQYSSWGQKVELYGRVINLTTRDIRIVAATWNTWQRIKPDTIEGTQEINKSMGGFPYLDIPRSFVSPPHRIVTLDLNPDYFDVGVGRTITFSYQMTYESTPEVNTMCERATWHLIMP